MRALLRLGIAFLIAVMGLATASVTTHALSSPESVAAVVFSHNASQHSGPTTGRAVERGPPAAYDHDTTYDAADRWSRGASSHLEEPTALNGTTNYDPTGLREVASTAGTTSEPARVANDGPLSLQRWRVAAKTVPRQIDASWGGLIKYKHGGPMTAIEHINYRHAYTFGFSNVSKYSKGTSVRSIQGYVDDALRQGSVSAEGTMVRHNIGRVIGTDQLGNPVTGIQIYVRNGQIQTAFPVAWP